MNVLHLSYYDAHGGAATGALRLHRELVRAGVGSHMLVAEKRGYDPHTTRLPKLHGDYIRTIGTKLDQRPLGFYPQRNPTVTWSFNLLGNGIMRLVRQHQPDVVHLQWVGYGYVPVGALARLGVPLVWTLHDEWAYTGGCHYTEGCTRYQTGCGCCPLLGSDHPQDLTARVFRAKRKHWAALPLQLVAPSQWLAERVQSSALLSGYPLRVIPYGLDTAVFRPYDRQAARAILGLPADKRLILFGAVSATDPRKGGTLLAGALRGLAAERDDLALAVFGSDSEQPLSGIQTHALGYIRDERLLALVYSAADVCVVPSQQEMFGLVAQEALACGTPCVAFRVGGLPQVIEHQRTGYLAAPADADDLAAGIRWVLADSTRYAALCEAARSSAVARYNIADVAQHYAELYAGLAGSFVDEAV